MTNQPALSSVVWRLAVGTAFVLLVIVFLYVGITLLHALQTGINV